MGKLIDADDLIEVWKWQIEFMKSHGVEYCESSWEKVFDDFITDVRQQKVIDAVPVVRCKDCEFCKPIKGNENAF